MRKKDHRLIDRYAVILFGLAVVFTTATIAWSSWNISDNLTRQRAWRRSELRIVELCGVIVHLDEVLTMSARMAAATGDPSWEERYRLHEPQLDLAIREAISIAPTGDISRAAELTDQANLRLIEIENKGFELVRAGREGEARDLLFGKDYESLKVTYAAGMNQLEQALHEAAGAHSDDHSSALALGSVSLVAVLLALITGWYLTLRALGGWREALATSVAARRHSENRYRELLDNANDIIYTHDTQGNFTSMNATAKRVTGYLAEDVTKLNIGEILPPGGLERARKMIARKLQGGASTTYELDLISRNGRLVPIEVSSRLIEREGEPDEILGIARDITRRKAAEERLRVSEERYRSLIENIEEGVYEVDLKGNFTFFNAAIVKMMGYEAKQLSGMHYREYMEAQDAEKVFAVFNEVFVSGVPRRGVVWELTRLDGDKIAVDGSVSLILDAQGDPTGFRSVLRDITERKRSEQEKERLEEQLRQSQKLEAIGTLAGGIAHDFNNLLAGILGYANMLTIKSDPGSDVRRAAETIERAAERASDLTRQLLGFARKGKLQSVPVDLQETIDEVVTLLGRTIDKSITIRVNPYSGTPCAFGDPNQIQQVLINLAVNARDAMPEGGTLSFAVDVVEFREEDCPNNPDSRPGRFIRVSVSDTGQGVPKESRERIFEPFFTTKDPGKGTGMGLAMVYGIVKNHNGWIQLYSEPGMGATFRVYLPLALETDAACLGEEFSAPAPGTGKILVVDDEDVVRQMATEMLEMLGYSVVTACDGQEAINIYRDNGEDIDLALIDMVMPRMNGGDCFRALREIDPEIKAVLTTGYDRDGAAQELLDQGMAGYIQKPYRINQISEVFEAALG